MAEEAAAPSSEADGKRACFGYGSNSVRQLRGRLEDQALVGYPACIRGQVLAFGGPNTTWAHDDGGETGGTGTIVPCEGEVALGTVCFLTPEQLEVLDGFEGVPHVYQRREFVAEVLQGGAWASLPVIAYVRQHTEWFPPSEAYRCAVLRNLRGSFPALHTLAIRDHEGRERESWQHPGFPQLGLGAFLFEVGVRRQEPWQLPRRIGIVRAALHEVGIRSGQAAAAPWDDPPEGARALPFEEEEVAIIRRLLSLPEAGADLQDNLDEDDAQAERAAELPS